MKHSDSVFEANPMGSQKIRQYLYPSTCLSNFPGGPGFTENMLAECFIVAADLPMDELMKRTHAIKKTVNRKPRLTVFK
jgi:hypothetical protein